MREQRDGVDNAARRQRTAQARAKRIHPRQPQVRTLKLQPQEFGPKNRRVVRHVDLIVSAPWFDIQHARQQTRAPINVSNVYRPEWTICNKGEYNERHANSVGATRVHPSRTHRDGLGARVVRSFRHLLCSLLLSLRFLARRSLLLELRARLHQRVRDD